MKELMFQDKKVRLIECDGLIWASAADIAMALGYSRSDKVTRIYERHQVEFSKSMSITIETPTSGVSGNLRTTTRYFSLRGAHLVAMFARTKAAQDFRVWVLDLIEHHQTKPSVLQEWYAAKARIETESAVASLCSKGLSRWRIIKNHLQDKLCRLENEMQPQLFLH